MGVLYLAALIVGAGLVVLQIALAHFGEVDAAHDLDGHDHDSGGAAIFFSTRFWTYALLAFGMVGSALHWFGLASFPVTLVLSIGSGFASGCFAALTFRALRASAANSTAGLDESVGQVARVLLPCSKGRVGKVRLSLKGNQVDVMATTDEAEIAAGASVIVDEVRGDVVHVVTAPRELSP